MCVDILLTAQFINDWINHLLAWDEGAQQHDNLHSYPPPSQTLHTLYTKQSNKRKSLGVNHADCIKSGHKAEQIQQ